MENWRLSRIEAELGMLKMDMQDSPDVVSILPEVRDDHVKSIQGNVGGETEIAASAEDDLLNKIVIRPAYRKSSHRKADASKAVQMIKEKYDSPNAVTKPGLNATTIDPHRPTPDGLRVTDEGTWGPSAPDICRVESSQPGGQRLSVEASTTRLSVCDSFQGGTPAVHQIPPPTVAAPRPPAFDFNATGYHPPTSVPSDDPPPRPCSVPRSPSRPGPPTTTKPPSTLYLGQLMAAQQSRYDHARLSPGSSYPYTGGNGGAASSSSMATIQPPGVVMVQPYVPQSESPSGTSSSFPDPPSELFLKGYLLPQRQPPSPVSTTLDFQAMSSFGHLDDSFIMAVPPPPPPGNEEVFDHPGHDFDNRAGDTSSRPDYHFRKRNEPVTMEPVTMEPVTMESVTMEPVTMEPVTMEPVTMETTTTPTIRHLAVDSSSSSISRPRYGTLKATRSTNPSQRSTDPHGGDFFPPRGPCLTDDDRNQVEMFYRSHKTRLYVARCEANLYSGSARRHSVVAPSRAGAAARAAAESPENWSFVKCGIPVLLLDSGESRRQRRLHIIVAERGSGFVLWRDTFDHLTGYSVSPNVGFHTMHLSKDHTKLAGLYFADSLSATDFFDFLSNLTSDPDDPLLSLSNGSRKKKKKIGSCKDNNRKEKRKPIRREDISLPCCFTHVTKLDRNDGLHILLSEDSLLLQKEIETEVEPTESAFYPSKAPLPV